MKRFMKKALSIALAGAMVLSLSITALAADPATLNTDTGIDGTTAQTAAGLGDGYKVEGSGENEGNGKSYDDKYLITVPKIGENAFNMLIDPYDLITISKGAGYTGKTFATDANYLYFPNFKAGDNNTLAIDKYSAISDPMKIVNKGSIPVTVDLDVQLDKGAMTGLEIVKDQAALDKAEADGKAAIYLAVKNASGTFPVVTKDDATPTFTVTDAASGFEKFVVDAKFAYTANATSGITKLMNADGAVTWSLSVDATETGGAVTVTPAIAESQTDLLTRVSVPDAVTVSLGTFAAPLASATATVNFQSTGEGTPIVATATFKFDPSAVYNEADNDAATPVPASYGKIDDNDTRALPTVTLAAKSGAQISEDIENTADAWELKKTANSNKEYQWEQTSAFTNATDDKYQMASYSLTGALSSGVTEKGAAAWQAEFRKDSSNDSIKVTMVWKVKKCTVQGPSAKVTTKLTTATGQGVVAYSLGDGAKAASDISSIEYALKTATTKTTLAANVYRVDTAAKTITFTNNSTIKLQTNTYVYINFDNGATVTVDLSKLG